MWPSSACCVLTPRSPITTRALSSVRFWSSRLSSSRAFPFNLVFDEPAPLDPLPNRGGETGVGEPSKLQVLVLPDSECLSDEQLTRIRSFVEQGGGLVAIGQAGLYDEWRRLRPEPGLKGLVDGQARAHDYEEEVQETTAAGHTQRKTSGKGRVVYLPRSNLTARFPNLSPISTSATVFGSARATGRNSSPRSAGPPTRTCPSRSRDRISWSPILSSRTRGSGGFSTWLTTMRRRRPPFLPCNARCESRVGTW